MMGRILHPGSCRYNKTCAVDYVPPVKCGSPEPAANTDPDARSSTISQPAGFSQAPKIFPLFSVGLFAYQEVTLVIHNLLT